jgi:serine/threonine-protein kinase SRPK3
MPLCRRDEYVCMKSMVCDYSSVQREIAAHKVLSESAKTSEAAGKQYVRQALDHFEISQDDRNYHFLIYEPLGATLDFFLDFCDRSLPIYYVKELTYQILQALEFIHGAQVIHAGSTLPLSHPIL